MLIYTSRSLPITKKDVLIFERNNPNCVEYVKIAPHNYQNDHFSKCVRYEKPKSAPKLVYELSEITQSISQFLRLV